MCSTCLIVEKNERKRQGRKLLSILGLSTVSFHSFTLLLLPSSVFANFVLRSLYGYDCCWGQCWCLGLCFLASWLHFDFVSSVMLVWQENEGKKMIEMEWKVMKIQKVEKQITNDWSFFHVSVLLLLLVGLFIFP